MKSQLVVSLAHSLSRTYIRARSPFFQRGLFLAVVISAAISVRDSVLRLSNRDPSPRSIESDRHCALHLHALRLPRDSGLCFAYNLKAIVNVDNLCDPHGFLLIHRSSNVPADPREIVERCRRRRVKALRVSENTRDATAAAICRPRARKRIFLTSSGHRESSQNSGPY